MIFEGPIPIVAGGVPIGKIPAELLEAVINLSSEGPVDGVGAPLSTEEILVRVKGAMAARAAARW